MASNSVGERGRDDNVSRRSILRAVKRAATCSLACTLAWAASLALVIVAAACGESSPPPPMADGPVADLLVLNGRVYTADEQGTMAQAVAVSGNRIFRVGTDIDLSALRGPRHV